jgi:anaerobic selenocysteine-containing dehydrogenase
VEWKPRVLAPRGEARSEWRIFKDLSRAAGVPFLNDPWIDRLARLVDRLGGDFDESWLYRFLLLTGPRLSLKGLQKAPGGRVLSEIRFGEWLDRGLDTPSGRMQLAPADLVSALPEALAVPPLPDEDWPLVLISGARRLASFNSWTHHIAALTERLGGNWATLHPDDAEGCGVCDGEKVRIVSRGGAIEIEARLSRDIRPGVIAIHQFWGHVYDLGTTTSRRFPGVNVNHLHPDEARDRFSGMPIFNGTPCRVERI